MGFSIIATGDSLMTQRLSREDKNSRELKALFAQYDVRFTNLELVLHDFDVCPSAVSGGTWVAARPRILDDLKWLGVNLYAAATNHALDWGHEGLLATLRHFEETDTAYAGIGRNLAEASRANYLETSEGRVALISVCSTAKDWHIAGEQRPDLQGRPGANLIRFKSIHYVPAKDLETLKSIVDRTDVNARRFQLEREGWVAPEEGYAIGDIRFEARETPGTGTFCNQKDVRRFLRYLDEAKRQADVVLVSHHVHEYRGSDKAVSSDFAREFAHICIDNGAHAYLGHGPHIVRGFEIYKKKPVLYSLGDFFLQNESVERQPTEFYSTYDLGPECTPIDGFEARSAKGARGIAINRKAFESVMAAFTVENGQIDSVEIIPITLAFEKHRSRKGRPQLASVEDGERILQDLQKLSDEYGTRIEIKNGRGYMAIR